jgi:hypothetical protein
LTLLLQPLHWCSSKLQGAKVMLQIEKDIPVPEQTTKYPFKDMETGDSIYFEDERQANSARVSALRFAGRQEAVWGFTLRKTDPDRDKVGWRLWRTE